MMMFIAGSYQSSSYISTSAAGAEHAGSTSVCAREIGNGRAADESVRRADAERTSKVRAGAYGAADHGKRPASELIGESAAIGAAQATA